MWVSGGWGGGRVGRGKGDLSRKLRPFPAFRGDKEPEGVGMGEILGDLRVRGCVCVRMSVFGCMPGVCVCAWMFA